MSGSENRPIQLKQANGCAELIINAPHRRNALNLSMWSSLPVLVRTVDADKAARAVIIHGGAHGHFAAGVDISEFETIYADEDSTRQTTATISEALDAIERCSKPVIAAIEGSCFGAGVSLAMACDFRIAAADAMFGIPPAKLGIVYPPADLRRLVNAVGASQAKRMLFTADRFSGKDAVGMGLVEQMVEPGEALEAARRCAAGIGDNSAWSVRTLKTMVAGLTDGTSDDALLDYMVEGAAGADFREGYRAFLEKRKADFPSN